MTQEFSTITVYLPVSESLGRLGRYSDTLNPLVVKWLNENVGTQAPNYQHFVANLDNDKYNWCHQGKHYSPESHYTEVCHAFSFRNDSQALMFKLAWGGV